MALRHFFLTIPLSSLILTMFFYFVVPWANLQLEWQAMLAVITAVNVAVTVIAILLIKDGRNKRGPSK